MLWKKLYGKKYRFRWNIRRRVFLALNDIFFFIDSVVRLLSAYSVIMIFFFLPVPDLRVTLLGECVSDIIIIIITIIRNIVAESGGGGSPLTRRWVLYYIPGKGYIQELERQQLTYRRHSLRRARTIPPLPPPLIYSHVSSCRGST